MARGIFHAFTAIRHTQMRKTCGGTRCNFPPISSQSNGFGVCPRALVAASSVYAGRHPVKLRAEITHSAASIIQWV